MHIDKNIEIDIKQKIIDWRFKVNPIIAPNLSFEDINKKKYRASVLMAYSDMQFVFNAYKVILKRLPDNEGLLYYTKKIRQDFSKVKLLRELLASPEGKQHQVKITGLMLSDLRDKIQKLRITLFFKNLFNNICSFINFNIHHKKMVSIIYDLEAELQNKQSHIRDLKASITELNNKVNQHSREIKTLNEEVGINLKAHIADWENFYLSLENKFRGSREMIKNRLNVYVDIVYSVKIDSIQKPILDIGCGRGEWLEILKEKKMNALGVDINHAMVKDCLQQNLVAVNEDAIKYLQQQPANRFKAITGFQIIEHLPFITLINLIDEAWRTLERGGVLIFETPNPVNVSVGSCSFYLDPTHKKPLPPSLMEFIFNYKKFSQIQILEFNFSSHHEIKENNQPYSLNSGQDYAVIGYKK